MKKVSSHRPYSKHAVSSKKKDIYRVKNWARYNQALVQRGSLTVWLEQDSIDHWHYTGPLQRGAQFHYSDLAIETALTFRTLYNLPLRQTQGFVDSLLSLMGLALSSPDYSTLSRRQAHLTVDLPVKPVGQPIHLVVDSTGLKVYGESEWKVRQHGWTQRRTWRELHLGINADTGEVVAQTLTEAGTDDASQVKPLLRQIPQTIARCYGDGAYDRWKVHRVLAYPGQGDGPIDAVIPPQRNASVRKSKRHYRHIQARNERVETIEQQGRKRWKQHTGYYRRSLAETGIARYKRIIGPKLRARVFLRQQVEARLGCKRLNRMTQLGMPQAYKVEVGG
jgi:hypothetical protein